MNPEVVSRNTKKAFYTPEKCWITESWNTPRDTALSIARARVESGVTTRWHALEGIQERYVIVTGTGHVEVGDLPPTEVKPGDVVIIPPGVRQRVTNTGLSDLIFYALCTPRFKPSCYRDLEQA
jgi:mannose-6-phosphate isomerase-like protein (cupin superfamily)